MKDRLRECPRCKSSVEWEYMDWISETGDGDDGTGWIVCECGIKSPRMSKEEAIEWWNTRVIDPLMEEMAEALTDAIDLNGNGCIANDDKIDLWESLVQNTRRHSNEK